MALLAGAFVLCLLSALTDMAWYGRIRDGSPIVSVVRAGLQLAAIGATLGWVAGRTRRGLPVALVALATAVVAYNLMVRWTGDQVATYVAWVIGWTTLAAAEGRLVSRTKRDWDDIVGRGAVASALTGLAVYIHSTGPGQSLAAVLPPLGHLIGWFVFWILGLGTVSLSIPERPPKIWSRTASPED